jgi:hypothetical protein
MNDFDETKLIVSTTHMPQDLILINQIILRVLF